MHGTQYRPAAMGSHYRFFTEWRVAGTVEEVRAVLADPDEGAVTRWWPSVYLGITELEKSGPDGVGRTLDLYTTGWLPYTLRWTLRVTEAVTDEGYALEATGDLEGTGRWVFLQDGPEVVITYDWRVHASKPLLRRLSWLLRPVFSANHHWAMRMGEESLRLELRRRRHDPAESSGPEVLAVPPPPPPTFAWMTRRRGSSQGIAAG
jgi:hypothetical protein